MQSDHSPLFRRSVIGLVLIALAAPVVIWGAGKSLASMYNSPVMWISPSNVKRQQFFEFVQTFDSPDSILISWDGCDIDDDRLDRFAEAMSREDSKHRETSSQSLFHRFVTGRGALLELQSDPLRLSREQAVERLRGSLIGPEQRTFAIAVLTASGTQESDLAIEMIRNVLESELKLDAESYYLVGTPVIGKAIDDASYHSMVWLTLPSTAVTVLLCCLILRSWRLILLVLGVGYFGEQLAISLVYFSGQTMNAILIVMSPLVFVLSASTGIHLCNYYRDEVRLAGIHGAAERTLQKGWKPCLLSTITTVAGLLSLLVSDITAVRQFAWISSVSVLLTTLLMLVTLPGVAAGLPATTDMDRWQRRWIDAGFAKFSSLVIRARFLITVGCVMAVLVAGFGLTRMHTEVQVFSLLTEDNAVAQDHRWFEKNLVGLISVETVVRFSADSKLSVVDRMKIVRGMEEVAKGLEPTKGTSSGLTFMPKISASKSASARIRRILIEKRFARDRESLIELGYLRDSDDGELWRITSRIPAFERVDYTTHLAKLDARSKGVLDAADLDGSEATVWVTGVVPVVNSAQDILLRDLTSSFVAALVIIGVVTILGFGNLTLGLVAMIPNVFPLVLLFGVLGWLGQPLDIGVMMTASVALGIAVDDTVHFLFCCRQEVKSGANPSQAVVTTISQSGKAIMQTSIVCGLSLLIFGLSDFGPTVRFAWMMFWLLVAALVADLFLLPALLVGVLKFVLNDDWSERVKQSRSDI